tara:strand:+ start:460 stop:2277 length:1818 start_codon:yes stop_codon:yes gene_type:complete
MIANKVLKNFNLDLSDLPASAETREFSIIGDEGLEFILEIKNEDNYYYNFKTNLFQAADARLDGLITNNNSYKGSIKFPTVTDDDQYDIFLYVLPGGKHADYQEFRFRDGSIDINSSVGSNSLMMQKVIYQYTDVTLTLSPYSPNSVTDLIKSSTRKDFTATLSRGKSTGSVPFSVSCEVNAATKCYQILKQPSTLDILSFLTPTVGSAPEKLPGENIYPTARDAFTGDDVNGAVTSGTNVRMDAVDISDNIAAGDKITSPVTTDTVNGDFSGGATAITMDSAVATKMAVGDQVTGTAALDAGIFTVASIDSTNVFSLNASAAIDDGTTLTFSSKVNRSLTTVGALFPVTATDFTISQAIQFRDDQPLTFTPQMNYQWPLDSIEGITEGMIVVPSTNVTANTKTSRYEDTVTLYEGTESEEKVIKNKAPFAITKNQKPTVVKGLVTVQPGNIVFNKQQKLALADDSLKIGGYGETHIKNITGYDIKFSNLKLKLTPVITTTTATCINSTSVVVSERAGILDNVSTVSGIGIDPTTSNPLVASGAGAVSGAGTIVLNRAQNLESGATLTFAEAGQLATITGDIEIIKVGTGSATLRFDMEKLLSIT